MAIGIVIFYYSDGRRNGLLACDFPQLQPLFLFDQSSGHAKKLFGGCDDIFCMGVKYGGVQLIIKGLKVKGSDFGEHNQENRHDWTKSLKHAFPKLKNCIDLDGPA